MKNGILLLIGLVFFSCNKKEVKSVEKNSPKNKPYIISLEDKKLQDYSDSVKNSIPLVPRGISSESNLIIDKNFNLFYYQRNPMGFGCGTGMENDTIPHFLDLEVKDLIRLPKENLEKFIAKNIFTKEKRKQILVIASQNDTISESEISNFIYNLKVPIYVIRRTTQEEDTVLKYKKNNDYYNPNTIRWDKTKIKFLE